MNARGSGPPGPPGWLRHRSKYRGALVVFLTTIALSAGVASCVSEERQSDSICAELAQFANASVDGQLHAIELLNDWGCTYYGSGDGSMGCKGCSRDSADAPAKRFCGYLMEHTSTEFPVLNFARVMTCMADQYVLPSRDRFKADRFANRLIWSDTAEAVRPGIRVSIEYLTNLKDRPNVLRISARKRGF